MTTSPERKTSSVPLTCGICGKSSKEVELLMTGPKGGIICDQCVEWFHELVTEHRSFQAYHTPGTGPMRVDPIATFLTHARSPKQPERLRQPHHRKLATDA
jgi:hypothetical protein